MTTVGLAQIKVVPERPDLNVAKMLEYMEKAAAAKVDLLVFPELTIPGNLIGDTWEDNAFIADCGLWGQKIIAATAQKPEMTVIFGNIVCAKDTTGRVYLHNASFIAQKGRLLGRENYLYPYRVKTRLPFSRAFVHEGDYFTNNEEMALRDHQELIDLLVPVETQIGEKTYNVGCITCADGWGSSASSPDVLMLMTKKSKVDFFVNISASYFVDGKNNSRTHNFSNQAQRAKKPIIYVNNVGIQNNGKTVYAFDGNSCIYDATGRITAKASSWQEELLVAEIPIKKFLPEIEPNQDGTIGDIYTALVYGIKEFSAGLGLKKAVIGLSGGIDSAVSACLLVAALGAENVLAINLPTEFNSETTKNIAAELAQKLGLNYAVMPIEKNYLATIDQIEKTAITNLADNKKTKLKLSPLAKENIQVRQRGAGVLAAAAAAFGGAVICNSNKTELTVGYSTMYGDATGYLAPLGDLWKGQVYELANYINSHHNYIPQACLELPPSAELSAQQNVDEGKGDPLFYPYHDRLFRSWVEQGNNIADTLSLYVKNNLNQDIGCTSQELNHACPTVEAFIKDAEHWWSLYKGLAVAKRIQAPPILAISNRAFGFDLAESQNGAYFTQEYLHTKELLLGK